MATGWRMTGCLRLATNEDRWTEFRRLATTARSFGMEMHLIGADEVKRMWPLMDTSDVIGASWLPSDGQANPSDITQALAKAARMHGARIFESVRVEGFAMEGRRITAVNSDHGPIHCETVVNCTGLWARQVGAMAGVTVPLQPVQHQYIITEKIEGLSRDTPTVRDPDRRIYFKEEVGGLVMGGYEPNPQPWDTGQSSGDIPDGWEFQLLNDDYDHFEQHLTQAIARVPGLKETGIRQMINGAESFTPDGNFILGRASECANMYVGAGFNAFGIAAGGGAGWVLADWVVHGEAPLDLWVVDVNRFSSVHRDRIWVRERTLEAYGRHYAIAYPHEEYASGRPRIVSPLYGRLKAQRAVFGSKLGWERANWFAPPDVAPRDDCAMGRQNWFDAVGVEHAHVREKVGVFDQSSFAKFELIGHDAAEALELICANHVARKPGQLAYTQILNSRGGIECDLTVARLSEDHFYIVTGTGSRTHDFAWIEEHLPAGTDVRLSDVTESYGTLSLMGPRAREVLSAVTKADVSNAGFPFGRIRELTIAGHRVYALRVTFVGELGWDLMAPAAGTADVFDVLMDSGKPHEVRPAGYRAIESLRLEKGYRVWGADITPMDSPFEAGLGWAVKLRRGAYFIGREACERQSETTPKKRLAGFTTRDPSVVLVGRETILRNGKPVGYLTSGGYGYSIGKPIGYGYVRAQDGVDDEFLMSGRYELMVASEAIPATIHMKPLYDPQGQRVKA